MKPRVGHIGFLNCLPIYYGLVKRSGILDLHLVQGTPTELNARLLEGDLDISPISSIQYGRHAERLLLLPGPTVSCHGAVRSILLLSRRPLGQLNGRKVGLTSASATSHVLLKILLERAYGVRPEYFLFGDDPEEAFAGGGDAALLIGDRALAHLNASEEYAVFDLGSEWQRYAQAGMVFAVWAVRREFAAARPDLVAHCWSLFQDSIDYCGSRFGRIARDASRWERFSPSFLEEYFRTLSFSFEPSLRQGLMRFFREAVAIGELRDVPALCVADLSMPASTCRTGAVE